MPPRSSESRTKTQARLESPSEMSFGDMSFGDMAQITLDAIGDAVLVVDPEGTVIYLNKVAEKMTGWASSLAVGRAVEDVFFIVDGVTRERATSPSYRAISEKRIVELALGSFLIRRGGEDLAIEDSAAPILNHDGAVAGAVIVFHDARQSRSEIHRMDHLAQHDFLTGLPNRLLMLERLDRALGMARRHNKVVALLFIDLDNFKIINDQYGHSMGDELLRELSSTMVACVRETDTVGRLGGDEFVILLPQIEELKDACQVAEKLLALCASPRTVACEELQVTLSIGIAAFPYDGTDAMALMKSADRAMYEAKQLGRNGYQVAGLRR